MKKFYAGIGSRQTPTSLKPLIKHIVEHLNSKNYTLRSGGAEGADTFFEEYANDNEIYLPWKNFNSNSSPLYDISSLALHTAKQFHPRWSALSPAAQKLMARNCYQVLGYDLKTPVEFVICWTSDGLASGGTGQAIRVAEHHSIPVVNLKNSKHVVSLFKHLGIPEF